ncbi:hypothetical protein VTI74DRAFT_5205 [Chaetomium olivicolor]
MGMVMGMMMGMGMVMDSGCDSVALLCILPGHLLGEFWVTWGPSQTPVGPTISTASASDCNCPGSSQLADLFAWIRKLQTQNFLPAFRPSTFADNTRSLSHPELGTGENQLGCGDEGRARAERAVGSREASPRC